MSSICVIPARGGSKRIPRKNIRVFGGKPMIAWPVLAALESGAFDEVIVSTDDQEIAEIAVECGASVPFMRPAELSDDHTGVMPVVRHAITFLRDSGRAPVLAACVYPTAPFLRAGSLDRAMEELKRTDADFVLSVTSFEYPVQRALKLDEGGRLRFAQPEFALTRSQDLEHRYHDAGQFFAGRAAAMMEYDAVLFARCLPLVIPRDEAVDIDTEEDWQFAGKLHALRHE